MKAKITVRSVEATQPQARDVILWDSEVPGFGLKVTPRGRKSYFLYYRTQSGQQRRPTIGLHGAIKPEAARDIARRWLLEVTNGQDPSKDRTAGREAPTVKELASRYLEEHAEPRKKDSSIRNDRRLLAVHIVPSIGKTKVASVTRSDIAKLHHSLRTTPYEANRVLALCSKMFQLAERWGLRPDASNPARNIDRFREKARERYLSDAEMARLWEVLNSDEARGNVSADALLAFKLLILTGRRLGEILSLRWEWVDLEARTMTLPDTKTGVLSVPLAAVAVQLLEQHRTRSKPLPERGYVVRGQKKGAHLVNAQKPWRFVRKMAGLDDVRIHDLRHTYASRAVELGMSLPMIGKLLGHSQPATTARYAHLAQDPVRWAAASVEERILLSQKSTFGGRGSS